MKILHINTGQEGGAALCAIRINKALVHQGVECRMPWVCDVWGMRFKLKKALKHLDTVPYLHQPCSNFTNIAHHPLVEWADVIHLHWVPEFVDYPTFFQQ